MDHQNLCAVGTLADKVWSLARVPVRAPLDVSGPGHKVIRFLTLHSPVSGKLAVPHAAKTAQKTLENSISRPSAPTRFSDFSPWFSALVLVSAQVNSMRCPYPDR